MQIKDLAQQNEEKAQESENKRKDVTRLTKKIME